MPCNISNHSMFSATCQELHCSVCPRTAAEHPCGFRNGVEIVESIHCAKHACRRVENNVACTMRKEQIGRYCFKHTECKDETCTNLARPEIQVFCSTHECSDPSCHESKTANHAQCEQHRSNCGHADCGKTELGGTQYCARHRCRKKGCRNESVAADEGECQFHVRCEEKGCGRVRAEKLDGGFETRCYLHVRGTCGSCGAEVASSEVYCLIHAPMQRAGENALCTEPKARGNEKAVAKASKNRPDENAPGIEPKVHIKKKVIAKASENRLDENAPYIEPKARDDEKAVANASENRPDSALNSFLEDYNDNSKYYKELATHVEGICREILDKMEIKGLVTSRAKDCKSLQEKLPKRTKKWGDKVASKKDVEEKIHDLAGVRMTLYFPDDVPEVTSVVTEVFERVIDPIVRTANREDARNVHNQAVEGTTGNQGSVSESSRTAELQSDVDKQRKQMAPLPSEYTHGPWRSLSVNDIVHHWKHSGYRAVHLVLKLKETTGRDVSKVISDVRNVNKDDNRPQLSENNKLTDRQVALARLRNIGITKVEIQVITVVMHAWSEVEHDIIYKNKYGLPESSRMNRMLDGINGLSITSEILLQELREAFNDLRIQDDFDLRDPKNLSKWLARNYAAGDAGSPGDLAFVKPLAKLLPIEPLKIWKGRDLREFINKHGIKQHPQENNRSLDLSAEILIALSREKAYEEALTQGRQGLDGEKSDHSRIEILYSMLQAANILNMLIAMNGWAMHQELRLLDSSKLQKFNKIAVILVHPRSDHSGSIDDLGQFAQEFLKEFLEDPLSGLQSLQNIVKAFAKLSFFVTLKDSSDEYFKARAATKGCHEQKEEIARKVEMGELPVLTDFTFLKEASKCEYHQLKGTPHSLFLWFKDPLFLPRCSGFPEEDDFKQQVSDTMPNGDIKWFARFHAVLGGTRSGSKEEALDSISLLYDERHDTYDPYWLRKELGYVDGPTIYRFLRWVEGKVWPNG